MDLIRRRRRRKKSGERQRKGSTMNKISEKKMSVVQLSGINTIYPLCTCLKHK